MIRIDRNVSIGSIESGLQSASRGDQVLQLASKLNADAFGGIAFVLQLIITWARSSAEQSMLRVYVDNDEELRHLACTPAGLVAFNVTRAIETVRGKEIILRKDALSNARSFVELMHSGSLPDLRDEFKTIIPFICLDNSQYFSRPTRLYQPNGKDVRSASDFTDLLWACLAALVPEGRRRLYNRDMVSSMATLVHEAFQNTHEHAQTDFKGNILQRSVRGLILGYRYILREKMSGISADQSPLRSYFEAWRPDIPDARHAQFIEISIFDSGPGLAQSWLARKDKLDRGIRSDSIGIEEEYKAVLCCLVKGGTTKDSDTSGNGIFRILDVVKRMGGFIRFRSGHLSLFKTFVTSGALQNDEASSPEDMFGGGIPQEPLPWADGTSISVLLPLNRAGFR